MIEHAIIILFGCGCMLATVCLIEKIYQAGTRAGTELVINRLQKAHFHIDILVCQDGMNFEIRLITAKTKKEDDPKCRTK